MSKHKDQTITSLQTNRYIKKSTYVNAVQEVVIENQEKYDVYFVTFTFTRNPYAPQFRLYEEFFEKFRKRLDCALLNNFTAYEKAPILYLFPEMNTDPNLPGLHFHGFMCVDKHCSINFKRKCVFQTFDEEIQDSELKIIGSRESVRLNAKFVHPFARKDKRKSISPLDEKQSKIPFRLKVKDYRIYKMTSEEDIQNTHRYSVKNFFKNSTLNTDSIIFERKVKPKPMKNAA